ncbi:hypothetical protein PoB_001308700 [Plakobranchus ocellatus]|uniref:EB domain-containing protein n=1 Tax=Plakobranchus ocellatus TaxID=259542 RepID=A0AAV3YUG0_9GAST|nr:hypothetical protein PoB_001308700 [Plakobranchus ocellatus]
MLLFHLLCLGLLSAAGALVAPPQFATRPICPDTNRTCVAGEAVCTGGRCNCLNDFPHGKGNFRCYPEATLSCEIKNDPSLQTFSGEGEAFPFPCRYLASHVQTILLNKLGQPIGTCEARIYAFNSKSKGKIYVSGFDIGITYTFTGSPNSVPYSFRQFATTDNSLNYESSAGFIGQALPFKPDGTDSVDFHNYGTGVHQAVSYEIANNRYRFQVTSRACSDWPGNFSHISNQFVLTLKVTSLTHPLCSASQGNFSNIPIQLVLTGQAPACGIDIGFVPFDRALRLGQHQIPGLAIAISELNVPTFLSPNDVMCLPKVDNGGELFKDIKRPSLSIEESLVLRAFKSAQPQNQVHSDNGECTAISNTLNDCQQNRQNQGIRKCHWILRNAKFMKCYDNTPGAQRLLALYRSCVASWCNNRACTQAITNIQQSGCAFLADVPELSSFINGNRCPSG